MPRCAPRPPAAGCSLRTEATLAFDGSEVADVAAVDDRLCVRFAAARVAGGWLQAIELDLSGATWTGAPADCLGRVAEGRAQVDGRERGLAIPSELAGDVALELHFANGATLVARGRALALAPRGELRFVEDFSC